MHETELWITKLFNEQIPSVGNTLIGLAGMPAQARPWANFVTMQLLVAAFIIVLFALLRPRLSPDRPGNLQHTFEMVYDFLSGQADEQVGHEGHRYVAYFGTIFIFILFSNLIGVIPGLEAPTMVPSVPAGCAIATFFYYNIVGVQANGIFKYLAHFAGPMPLLAPLMIPIELVSHLARPLSLTIRLFANMFAGDMVTLVFFSLVPIGVPIIFLGLHIGVSLLQTYIFVLLTTVYLQGAVSEEH